MVQLRQAGVEIAAIYPRLQEQGYVGSYQSVWRFVHRLEPGLPEATVRVEGQAGEEAQVDFGYAGVMLDPETGQARRSWAFVMTLAYSRHQYVEFVFDQKLGTWLECHRHAFEFFGGIPRRLVIDNLKAAILRACWDDPILDRLATVGRLLRLRTRFGDARLEAACRRALAFDDPAYATVKRILSEGLDRQTLAEALVPVSSARTFVRGVADLVGHALGGLSWN